MSGNLNRQRISYRPPGSLLVLHPGRMRQRHPNRPPVYQEFNIDCIRMAGCDRHNQRLVNTVHLLFGPAVSGVKILVHSDISNISPREMPSHEARPTLGPILLHCCTMKPARSFASDNNAGIHPEILKAISAANHGHAVGYGDDPYTSSAVQKFKQHFGDDAEVFIVFNGTAANCLSLKALTDSFHAVICTAVAHIYTDECAAPEKFTGCKLIPIAAPDGKLTVESVRHAFKSLRKRTSQLPPKRPFPPPHSAALQTNPLGLKNPHPPTPMPPLLKREVRKIPKVKIVKKVKPKGVSPKIPRHAIAKLQK